ncbi:MAG TPA: PEP-CTERM sorting domain-containing protein [Myxococcales bacterium]|nr:PEP-CTERM sorting domain-containing protein [Myxococcales bacterium]
MAGVHLCKLGFDRLGPRPRDLPPRVALGLRLFEDMGADPIFRVKDHCRHHIVVHAGADHLAKDSKQHLRPRRVFAWVVRIATVDNEHPRPGRYRSREIIEAVEALHVAQLDARATGGGRGLRAFLRAVEFVVDLLVVKAGNEYAAYLYTNALTGGMPNLGLWDTTDLGNKGMSHVTGYSIIPEPSTALMLSLGLVVLAVRNRNSAR